MDLVEVANLWGRAVHLRSACLVWRRRSVTIRQGSLVRGDKLSPDQRRKVMVLVRKYNRMVRDGGKRVSLSRWVEEQIKGS